jgi:hypothetical protein
VCLCGWKRTQFFFFWMIEGCPVCFSKTRDLLQVRAINITDENFHFRGSHQSLCEILLIFFFASSVLGREARKDDFFHREKRMLRRHIPASWVICFTSVPSIFIVYRSRSPFRVDVKTILSLFGETVASASYPFSVVSCFLILPLRSATKISYVSYTGHRYFPPGLRSGSVGTRHPPDV